MLYPPCLAPTSMDLFKLMGGKGITMNTLKQTCNLLTINKYSLTKEKLLHFTKASIFSFSHTSETKSKQQILEDVFPFLTIFKRVLSQACKLDDYLITQEDIKKIFLFLQERKWVDMKTLDNFCKGCSTPSRLEGKIELF